MALFGRDPKDDVIDLLTNERDYLRSKVKDLEQQLMALHSTHAYRLVYGEGEIPPPKPGEPDPFTLRSTTFKPEFNIAELERQFKPRRED